MKIIIVGAGIAGVSTFLFLQKHVSELTDLTITIYESHDPSTNPSIQDITFQELSSSSLVVGGAVGLSPNGMRIVRSLGEPVYQRVKSGGFLAERFVFKSARGWTLMNNSSGDQRGHPGCPEGEEEFCLSVSRHWLREAILQEVGAGKVLHKKVIRVTKGSKGKKPAVYFQDGSSEEADLVVGADGVRSEVLRGLFPNDDVKPIYNGLIGVGGFVDGPIPDEVAKQKSMVFTFGPNGFFGYSATSPNQTMWWSTCQAEDIPEQRKVPVRDMQEQLKERHGWWKDQAIQRIIAEAAVTQLYPVWTVPPLPHWGDGGLVVIGDAAHALDPTSGQGASQALEDARCIALLLAGFIKKSQENPDKLGLEEAIQLTSQSLYELKNPRVQKIAVRASRFSGSKKDMNIVAEMMMCGFLWILGKMPALAKRALGNVNEELYYWDYEKKIDELIEKYGGSQ